MPFGKVLQAAARSRTPWRRTFANVARSPEVDRLPLSGIRVLDMTRVLAGVGQTLPNVHFGVLIYVLFISLTAHRYLEISGKAIELSPGCLVNLLSRLVASDSRLMIFQGGGHQDRTSRERG